MTAAVLRGERCRLRPYRMSDAPDVAREAADFRVAQFMSLRFPHPYTLCDAETFISGALRSRSDWAIEVDGRYAGGIGFHTEEVPGVREFGYWLAVSMWGRGIATEAVALVTAHAFAEHAVRRLEAHVYAENLASARVLEKNGYRREGVLREFYLHRDGSVGDAIYYARLASDGVP